MYGFELINMSDVVPKYKIHKNILKKIKKLRSDKKEYLSICIPLLYIHIVIYH